MPVVGRTHELESIRSALRDHGIAVISGPGGIGKTTLARMVVREHTGARFVDLVGVTDAASFARAVRRDLEVSRHDTDLVAGVRAALANTTLVVLDNAEGNPEAAAALVNAVGPATRWLVTARDGIPGEHPTIALGGITPRETATLLRALNVDVPSTPAAEALGATLSGSPLAIHLAAGRIRLVGWERFVKLLGDTSRVLRGTDELPRHRDLTSLVRESLESLPPALHEALSALAPLPGLFDATIAEIAIGGEPLDALDHLEDLLRRGWIQREDASGTPLHRVFVGVRDVLVASDRAAQSTGSGVWRRLGLHLAERCRMLVPALHGPNPAQIRRRLESLSELLITCRNHTHDPELRLELGLGLDAWHSDASPFDVHAALLDELVTESESDGHPERRALALLARVRFRFLRSHYEAALHDLRRAIAIAPADSTRVRRLRIILESAAHRNGGELGIARARAERDLEWARELGDAEWRLRGHFNLAGVLGMTGEHEAAIEQFNRALGLARAQGQRRLEGLTLTNLGFVVAADGRSDEAIAWFRAALDVLDDVGDSVMVAKVGAQCMQLAFAAGDVAEGTALLDRVAAHAERCRDRESLGLANIGRALLARAEGREAEAQTWLTRALAVAGDPVPDWVRDRVEALRRPRTGVAGSPDVGLADGVRVTADGSSIRLGDGTVHQLGHRPSLRRILAAMLQGSDRGGALDVDALFDAGWPGEQALPEAGAARVYTAVATLRRMGLRGVLVRRDGGYALLRA